MPCSWIRASHFYRWDKSLLLFVCGLLLLSGCSTQKVNFQPLNSKLDLVWPSPPDSPRVRFVGDIFGEQNTLPHGRVHDGNPVFRWLTGQQAGQVQLNQMSRPIAGTVDAQGRILVVDAGLHEVWVFDPMQQQVDRWGVGNGLGFLSPVAVLAVGDEYWVSDAGSGLIWVLDKEGKLLRKLGKDQFVRPTGLAYAADVGLVYVADTGAHQVHALDKTGKERFRFGQHGDGDEGFNAPTFLAYNKGELFVSDTLNARIAVFDAEGNFKRSLGKRGLYVGEMVRPKGVAVSGQGVVLVVESYYGHILMYRPDGSFLMPMGGEGNVPGRFDLPVGIWTDPASQRFYVADTYNARVEVFELIGASQ